MPDERGEQGSLGLGGPGAGRHHEVAVDSLRSAQPQGPAPGQAGYRHRAVLPAQLPHPSVHGQGRDLPVPRAGEQLAVYPEVAGLGTVWPCGGYVVHGQAQDLGFVPGVEQGTGEHHQFVGGMVAGSSPSGWSTTPICDRF